MVPYIKYALIKFPIIRFVIIGGITGVCHGLLLWFLVEYSHWNDIVANIFATGISLHINFILNLNITWGHRKISGWKNLRAAWSKFILSRVISTILISLIYIALVFYGFDYKISFVISGLFTIPLYFVDEKFTYAR